MRKSKTTGINKMLIAIGFGVAICVAAIGPAFAGGHGGDRHHDHHGHDGGHYHGPVYVAPVPNVYYAPPPNYYAAPEPEYSPPAYGAPPPPSEGINLFFGGR